MKIIKLIIATIILSVTQANAQTQYTVVQTATGTLASNGEVKVGSYSPVSKQFTAYLYNNALVFDEKFDGSGNTYYKFVRKITNSESNLQRWNALDRSGTACEISVKDFESYSLIGIRYQNSTKFTVYKTL